jgi:hypothetical protein
VAAAPPDRAGWLSIAVCLAAVLPYLGTLDDYFVQDDFGVVQLLASKPWTTFPRWFVTAWMENIWGYTPDEIRPFPALSYQITSLWNAGAPHPHHLANILLHAANALLVFRIARVAASLGVGPAAAAGAAFALLPVQAESVAWITGRVDSLPALFYLASFLSYARWRETGSASRSLFAWALAWYFLALFSKQNTITMPASILLFDLLLAKRPSRFTIRPYVPFVVLTLAFLTLRFLVLGEALREGQMRGLRIEPLLAMLGRHVSRILLGGTDGLGWWAGAPLAICAIGIGAGLIQTSGAERRRMGATLLYFGPIWLTIGLAPVLLAGYESPRHAYLASAGWAVTLGVGLERFPASPPPWSGRRWPARLALGAAILVLVPYAVTLWPIVTDWERRAVVSRRAVAGLEEEAASAARGTLILVSAPVSSWEWAHPFMAQPPFTARDLTADRLIVTPMLLNCCGRRWYDMARDTIARWLAAGRGPVVALHFQSRTGERWRVSDAERPELRQLIPPLMDIRTPEGLDGAVVRILQDLAAPGAPRSDFRK